jgi:hypothetical protein
MFDLEGAGTWYVTVDDGRLAVNEGTKVGEGQADACIYCTEREFVRVASGADHENLVTALVRGALSVAGDLRFAQRLQLLLPITDDEVVRTPAAKTVREV